MFLLDVEALFQAYKDDVYRFALSYTKGIQDAEDVCQSVFLKLLEQPELEPGKEKAWLMAVTANQCRNLLKSGWWRKTAPLESAGQSECLETGETYRAVMALAPKYRAVVYLHYYEGLSTRETAKLLHISQSAVTTRLSRARQMLYEQLKEDAL